MARKKKKKEDALDLVDQLLANEDTKPKRKPGRPKGSKNKTKPKSKARVVKESKPSKDKATTHSGLEFVTPEMFEELGRPRFGYTTARIKQWKNKTAGYWEILLEYQRSAILWSKLAKTIDWYISTDESHLRLCRLEIAAFKESQGLTDHDFNEVLEISYHAQHRRKGMLKALKELGKVVLEDRKKCAKNDTERKKINFREVVKIPPNIRPVLEFVKASLSSIEDDVKGAIADLTGNPQVISEHACPDHINYKGLRKNRNGCPTCWYFYQYNKKNKIKEKRNR